ncbi:MAG TPA: ankyrin repeat domain-containing protein [Acetobacteraceae bacterium]|nr:ankyrin repeat domain-containing protein [Acetobacteraceae bacterium]
MRLLPVAIAATYLALAAAPAFAETDDEKQAEAMADAQERAKRAEQQKEDQAKAPPPAIPGAVSSGEVAPATKNAMEMSPNDALFDAINRGDGAAARDAMNRGAQLDAKNVLGQTPIDAAIEANRNDITFFLLSLRGTVGPTLRPQVVPASAHAARRPVFTATAAPARPVDNGTPNPAVGFNGF